MRREWFVWALAWSVYVMVIVLITGCASWDTFQSGAAVQGAKAADEQLETARWMNCEMPTAGALRRKYGANPEGLKAWQDYCSTQESRAVAP